MGSSFSAWAVQWTKVKAHTNWHGDMNQRADALAKECARKALRPLTKASRDFESKRAKDHTMLAGFHIMIAECNEKCFAPSVRDKPMRIFPMPSFVSHFEQARAIQLSCVISRKQCASCPVGTVFAKRICAYFHGMEWDPQALCQFA